jgi:hypothetical protein
MIYTIGGSGVKWHWPSWSDWLELYQDTPVTNWGAPGYVANNIYFTLLEKHKQITSDDHVMIIWSPVGEKLQWYDPEWIEQQDCWDFFPNKQGKIWHTKDDPWIGAYKTHPIHKASLTHLMVDTLATILHTQWLLDKIGCRYTMMFSVIPWVDSRPIHGPKRKFQTTWNNGIRFNPIEFKTAKKIIKLGPIKGIIDQIDWSRLIGIPESPYDLENYFGMHEFEFGSEHHNEYISLKHKVDNHPSALVHHDFCLKYLIGMDPLLGKFREMAIKISKKSIDIPIPDFIPDDFIAPPEIPKKFNFDSWIDSSTNLI